MKVPKCVQEWIRLRAYHAKQWSEYDWFIGEWCLKHDVEIDTCDAFGGVEGIVNPLESGRRIMDAIKEKS